MPLFEVAFTLVPNIKAQESGSEETLLVPPTAVMAKDTAAAIAVVAGQNAAKLATSDNSTLKSHVRDFRPL